MNIFSHKIVGWEMFQGESAYNVRRVFEPAVLAKQPMANVARR